MNTDHIEYYTEPELLKFLAEYNKPENWERYALPGIPAYYDIVHRLRQIDNEKGALEA